MLTFHFSGTHGSMTEPETLTAGMVGKTLLLEFSADWDGLLKTVVFSNGIVTQDVLCTGDPVTIPARVLETPLKTLTVGIYGVSPDGTLVIPTIRVDGPEILPGADPSGDPATNPNLPVWAQLQAMIGDPGELDTQEQSSLVAAINELNGKIPETGTAGEDGATFTPAVSQEGVLSWTNDKGLENPEPVCILGPQGDPGDDYVLTDDDKSEIAQLAASLVDTALLDVIGSGEVTA